MEARIYKDCLSRCLLCNGKDVLLLDTSQTCMELCFDCIKKLFDGYERKKAIEDNFEAMRRMVL